MASTVVKVDLDALKRIRTSTQEQANIIRKQYDELVKALLELVEGNHGQGGNWWEGADANKFKADLEFFDDVEKDIKDLEEYREKLDAAINAYTQLGQQIDTIMSSESQ